jgi:phospholipid/cholesterol/gamma-HCH transport system permease protein
LILAFPRARRGFLPRRAAMPGSVINFLAVVGRTFLNFLAGIGAVTLFTLQSLRALATPPFYLRAMGRQLLEIGYFSLPVVGLTALFTGAVLALQIHVGGARFNAESTVPTIVVIAITRELGPVLAGLMVAGRVGAAMAAEIGTMRVTEQIDALSTLSTNPFRYLVGPRLLAGTLMLPCLVAVGDVIGVLGGFLVGTKALDFNAVSYIKNTAQYLETIDVVSGLVKAAVFGFFIALMGCYHGYHSKGGAQGVGAATTNAVVSAFVLILVSNYFLTELFFNK